MTTLAKTLATLLVLSLPAVALADPDGADRRRGPPPEAVEACDTLVEDDPCAFTLYDDEVTGTCQPGPSPELPLACRPDDHEGPPPRER